MKYKNTHHIITNGDGPLTPTNFITFTPPYVVVTEHRDFYDATIQKHDRATLEERRSV